jgi:hypothetical protein
MAKAHSFAVTGPSTDACLWLPSGCVSHHLNGKMLSKAATNAHSTQAVGATCCALPRVSMAI